MRIIKSDKVLIAAELIISTGTLIHLPGIEGCRIFSRGIHWRMRSMMQATYNMTVNADTMQITQYILLLKGVKI